MNYVLFAIQNPVKVAVGVLLLLLFGLLALTAIPIQLTPNVDRPLITIQTDWVGRSPQDVESEILEPQEEKLKALTGLDKMTATAGQGSGTITLEFAIGTDLTRAGLEVSDKLREVRDYPADVTQPVVTIGASGVESAIAWLTLTTSDPTVDVRGLYDEVDRRIKPMLERVEGVGEVDIYGGQAREVHVRVDPTELAQRQITFNQLLQALRQHNVNVSAGDLVDGKVDARVRVVGQYDDLEQVRETIISYAVDGAPVRVRDLATVELGFEKQRSFVRWRGQDALAFPITRETGSNVMAVMADLRERVEFINANVLPDMHPSLRLIQVYDETVYISDAIDLVQSNLYVGGGLAVIVLLLFLRTIRPTLVIALAIPISIIGTFVIMTAFGRNLNVISLAGLAFAVGMVVDAAIVVLENIDRHLGMGKRPAQAALDGAREVWGAILASSLTTIAVFVPVLTIEEEAGQLFRDIAIAICAAVALSLVVSVTVIPSASARFLRTPREPRPGSLKSLFKHLFGLTYVLDRLRNLFANVIYWIIGPAPSVVLLRILIVAAFTLVSIGGAWYLMPPSSYLPSGNRNFVFGMLFNPPGYSLEHRGVIADRIEEQIRPYFKPDDRVTYDGPVGPRLDETVPPLEHFFLGTFGEFTFMGAISSDDEVVAPVVGLVSGAVNTIPGSFGFAAQFPLFGGDLAGTTSIELEITGSDTQQINALTETIFMQLMQRYGPMAVQPDPMNYNLPNPEGQFVIDPVRALALGIDNASLGLGVRALVDGATVGDYRYDGRSIDLVLMRPRDMELHIDQLGQVPIATVNPMTGESHVVPLAAISNFERTGGPQQIKRIEETRAVSLTVMVPPNVALESAMNDIDAMVAQMRDDGTIHGDLAVNLAGTADKLTNVRRSLLGEWQKDNVWASLLSLGTSRMFLALLVTFLLMAALFESFLYPFVIMFSVPLATVGGFMGLSITHWFMPSQQLDTLTMLGFVILIGVVVNNAILVVHQALNFMRGIGEGEGDTTEAMAPREAIRESVRSRVRPVLMTTLTSVCGMLPLVLMPGSGSELYRGLGSVVVGGLLVSGVFTLLVVPLLFSLVLDLKRVLYRWFGEELPETQHKPELV